MIVGVMRIELVIHEARSLKDKRRVVKSVKDRIRAAFNVSVAEVDHHDVYQRCTLGAAVVGNEAGHVHAQLDKIVDAVRAKVGAGLLEYTRELF